jgi:hypothetical protein
MLLAGACLPFLFFLLLSFLLPLPILIDPVNTSVGTYSVHTSLFMLQYQEEGRAMLFLVDSDYLGLRCDLPVTCVGGRP